MVMIIMLPHCHLNFIKQTGDNLLHTDSIIQITGYFVSPKTDFYVWVIRLSDFWATGKY